MVKSECKTFYVDIVAAPLVPPDSIEVLNVSQKKYIYMRQSDSIRITARGHREGFQPEEVSSECT
ncbi:MAG: hypothetical protein MJ200_00260 [Mycoplasmoidaceae bacterium]|nr:hypothetical protein [Mycoplasmoidaceae bacterium]